MMSKKITCSLFGSEKETNKVMKNPLMVMAGELRKSFPMASMLAGRKYQPEVILHPNTPEPPTPGWADPVTFTGHDITKALDILFYSDRPKPDPPLKPLFLDSSDLQFSLVGQNVYDALSYPSGRGGKPEGMLCNWDDPLRNMNEISKEIEARYHV